MARPSLAALIELNNFRWERAKPTRNFKSVATSLIAAKPYYEYVSGNTGVPWFIIAVIHERESSQSWTGSLAQGDPWNQVSIHKPANRGPFNSWEEAAIDALTECPPYAAKNTDWSAGGALTLLEQYNGLGYANRDEPSPYVWSGTDQYRSGKYIRDGVYSPTVIDVQLGCAGLLMAMMELDNSVGFTEPEAPATVESEPKKSMVASIFNWMKGT